MWLFQYQYNLVSKSKDRMSGESTIRIPRKPVLNEGKTWTSETLPQKFNFLKFTFWFHRSNRNAICISEIQVGTKILLQPSSNTRHRENPFGAHIEVYQNSPWVSNARLSEQLCRWSQIPNFQTWIMLSCSRVRFDVDTPEEEPAVDLRVVGVRQAQVQVEIHLHLWSSRLAELAWPNLPYYYLDVHKLSLVVITSS